MLGDKWVRLDAPQRLPDILRIGVTFYGEQTRGYPNTGVSGTCASARGENLRGER
jgi:hypothetical protein